MQASIVKHQQILGVKQYQITQAKHEFELYLAKIRIYPFLFFRSIRRRISSPDGFEASVERRLHFAGRSAETNPGLCADPRDRRRVAQRTEEDLSQLSSEKGRRQGRFPRDVLGRDWRSAGGHRRFQQWPFQRPGGNVGTRGRSGHRKLRDGHHLFAVAQSHQVGLIMCLYFNF